MEEQVGAFWHRVITRASNTRFPDAAVRLADVERTVGVLFRALGGDGGLQVTVAEQTEHGARRTWLQHIAGSHRKTALAWRDAAFLRLPEQIDFFPDTALNRDLYLWLAALAVEDTGQAGSWFLKNQGLVRATLARYPGLSRRYRRLVRAHVALRPDPASLPGVEAAAERGIRQALLDPGGVDDYLQGRRAPAPVPLWLHPDPPWLTTDSASSDAVEQQRNDNQLRRELEDLRKRGQRVKEPEADRGLITVRMENIFTWGEFVNVDRGSEDEDDLDRAESIARDLDQVAVSRGGKTTAATLRFDLDLPAESEDDMILSEGILLPEWHWKKRCMIPDHCRILPMLAANAQPCELPARLGPTAKRLRNQFQALAPARTWRRAQQDGQEIDLEAYLRFRADRSAGHGATGDGLYRDMRSGARDLACLLMADLSLSTDTWINDHHRVIDVIRDSLFLFAESLTATGDRFAIYGFSSRKRDPVRVHRVKAFDERYDSAVRGRIQAIKPGYYTRMGAALRYGSGLLADQPGGRRLLLILTDGKPNDLDQYEGRYGIEDTRRAVNEAKRLGLQPFCVTVDERGNDYLPHLFGAGGFVVIRDPNELPRHLPLLYARLTA